jgi:ribosomal protein L37E
MGRRRDTVTVRIPADLFARASNVADAEGTPVAWLIAHALREWLIAHAQVEERREERRRAAGTLTRDEDPWNPTITAEVVRMAPITTGTAGRDAPRIDPTSRRFVCPRCGAVSYHPADKAEGYCGRCHDYTGEPER